jgi:outer membrane protein
MKDERMRCVGAGLILMCAGMVAPVIAGDLTDWMTAPFADPLSSRPPQLDSGVRLPGDVVSVRCDDGVGSASEEISLLDAVHLGLCRDPQIHGAWASVKVQAAQAGGARAAYLPTIAAGISRQHQQSSHPASRFAGNSGITQDARYITLTWRLLDAGARGAHRRTADALLAAALANHDAALQKTLANVIGVYFDAQIARAGRESAARGEALARQTLQIAIRRESQGIGARTDILQAQTALAKAELERSRTQGRYQKALAALRMAMGLRQDTAMALSPAPDHQDAGHDLQQDLASWLIVAQMQHPALVSIRAQLDAQREKLEAVRSEGLPTLDFSYGRYINGRPNQSLSTSRESVIGLSLNIPIFDGFASTYKIRAAQAQIEVEQAQARETEQHILGEVARAHADAMAALGNLEVSKRLMDTASEALHEVRVKYDRGIVDILDMLNVQRALADAEQERIRSLSEWSMARLRLAAHAGVLGLQDVVK